MQLGFEAAKWLQTLIKEEILSIDTCRHCYVNAHSCSKFWYTKVCAKPHLLLWVKQQSYPYWPAKLLGTKGDTVSVRFFGAKHQRADIPSKGCRLFSKKFPSQPIKKRDQADFAQAQAVRFKIDLSKCS